MRLCKVVGTIVATQKDPKLIGSKLLVLRDLKLDGTLAGTYVVAVDSVGAGVGETVLVVSGSSARQTSKTADCPVDATVMAIVDTVETE